MPTVARGWNRPPGSPREGLVLPALEGGRKSRWYWDSPRTGRAAGPWLWWICAGSLGEAATLDVGSLAEGHMPTQRGRESWSGRASQKREHLS